MPDTENMGRKSRRLLLIVLSVVAVLIVLGIVGMALYMYTDLFRLEPEFVLLLNGEEQVTLEYGDHNEKYQLPEISTFLGDEEVDANIVIDQPYMDKLGTYTVTVTATYGEYTATEQQTVKVVDTHAPVITLNYIDGFFTEPGKEYEEEGFTAWDEVDGDLTELVQRTVSDGLVTYTVVDASGNSTQVERTIVYDDRTDPVLTLQGDKSVTITAGTPYEEPGYTATDNVDGDITANVVVSGEYDINVPGVYTIYYSITDGYGNSANDSRTLFVEKAQELEEEPSPYVDDSYLQGIGMVNDPENPGKKVIYLTFDDGPGEYTLELLEILEKYNVKVTFFVVGTANLDYLDEIAEAGHAIGIHSNTHKYEKIYVSEDAFFKDFYALYDKIYERTGIETKLHRFPGGSSNTTSRKYCKGIMSKLVKSVEAKGFEYFDWNVDSNDAGGATTSVEVYNNVVSGIKGKKAAVVLQHDVKLYSVAAVEKIIQWGLANDYTFLSLDENSPTCHHGTNN